jgi:hypothetical protein
MKKTRSLKSRDTVPINTTCPMVVFFFSGTRYPVQETAGARAVTERAPWAAALRRLSGKPSRYNNNLLRDPRYVTGTVRARVFTKRCRLSLLTNSALVYESKCGGIGRGCGVSAIEHNGYNCTHHVTWSPNKLRRSTPIFNLWSGQIRSLP